MYLALDLKKGRQHLDNGEFLDVVRIPFDEAYKMVLCGQIEDMKTCAVILKAYNYLINKNK